MKNININSRRVQIQRSSYPTPFQENLANSLTKNRRKTRGKRVTKGGSANHEVSRKNSFRETRDEMLLAKVPLRIYVLNETWRTRWNKLGHRVVRSEIYEWPVLEHSKETVRKLEMDFELCSRKKNAD